MLEAPIMPLIGSPFLLVGYPRPRWHWPYSIPDNNNSLIDPKGTSDSMLYKHIMPYIMKSLRVNFKRGTVGNVRSGDFFFIRYEDLMILVTVLEAGCGYIVITTKGLELKPTSCHHVEGL